MDILHSIVSSLDIEWQGIIVQIFGFVIFVVIMNKLLYKPLFGAIDQRQADIKSTYDQLDQDRDAMAHTRKEYEDRLAGIEVEARSHIQAAVKEAQELAAGIKADALKQGEALLEKARSDADRERERVYAEMRQQIVDLAIGAASKVVGESLDSSRHQALVNDFIGSIGPSGAGSNGATATL
jgi:F-type H+-transporting ATPase subunit b